jgi:hypothetical protein
LWVCGGIWLPRGGIFGVASSIYDHSFDVDGALSSIDGKRLQMERFLMIEDRVGSAKSIDEVIIWKSVMTLQVI